MSYGTSITVRTPFAETVSRVKEALLAQGFGVLTEIDVKATMQAKLGEQMEEYLILGACNPPLAHRALSADRGIGLLLPCNIVVRESAEGTVVDVLDPHIMATLTQDPEIEQVAQEAGRRLAAAVATLPT